MKVLNNKKLNQKNKNIIISYLKYFLLVLLLLTISLITVSCGKFGGDDNKQPEVEVPDDPIQRAAVNGLITSYRDSTMWQIQNVNVLGITPMAPSGELLELQDPKEIYCVCIEYEARYKVTWATSEGSPWEKTVRNILVIKTQGDQFMAVKPMNICTPFC